MNNSSFTTAFAVDQSAEEVFAAVNNVRAWWSGEIDGITDRLGAEFTYRYRDVHRSTQTITEMVPGKKVVWRVVDADINFVKDTHEWNGTTVVFDIARRHGKTELRFTHEGLIPAIECYDGCSGAWGFYINQSLRNLITTGKGEPNAKG
ncbi:SRPBCC domain-containing protein [Rhodoblastus sp. 17X3]|uniref:SRPBCC family protein n=1 Tax=Rhodoblastus sp. 17X3 TaxID=3047026 RepID=UPI0024B79F91|nr:SRPBCC domain-containing protein [Rhodoblastus sp. 17X3]MDI9847836.1 SRPBCC domain-containing protein [Rhodoblastus sp. 17X3]